MNPTTSPTPAASTDVLIVGAGPAGLASSALLAAYGVNAITITRYPGTANSPRAHITNQRTMEVFRDLDMEPEVLQASTSSDFMSNNVWATSFAGAEIARLQTWGTGIERHHEYERSSPSPMRNAPQHVLEPLLLERARASGADVRFSTILLEAAQDEEGVTATVKNTESEEQYTIRAKYLIGADGARSTVAEQFDFTMLGETGLGSALNIWLEADLTAYMAHRPGVLYWIQQPGSDFWVGSGTWICVKPFTEWVMLSMYDPGQGEPDISEEALLRRIHATIGDASVPVKIKAVSKWQINHMVAQSYQQGRAFLMGDAAHRHPPANGLGSNTSIQDAFNLCWKLAAVLNGSAPRTLLESYTQERQPVGQRVVDRALKSVADMGPIAKALGLKPGQSDEEGWASLAEVFEPGSRGQERRRELTDAVELQNYQFNAHGVEFDLRYASAAILEDGTDWPQAEDPELHYSPTTHPGAILPHAWVQKDQKRLSTIDVVGHGQFTLVTGIDNAIWKEVLPEVNELLGTDVRLAQIAARGDYDDVYGTWTKLREIEDDGALLVRPDRVISWRALTTPAQALEELARAINISSGREPDSRPLETSRK